MDPRHQEALVQRLISNPHDQAAISEAHAAGQQDPEGYAKLLEHVGLGTQEPALSSHWLNEAANVWMTTFNDAARAVEVLLSAVDRDPASETAYARLGELYRASTDPEKATMLLERRAFAYATHAAQDATLTSAAVAALKEVAHRTEKSEPKRSRAALSKALVLEPTDALAIYNLREAYKAAGEFAPALPLFAAELALEGDPERRKALTFDEAEVAKRASLADHGFEALMRLLGEHPDDVVIKAQVASWLLEVTRGGLPASTAHKEQAARAFVDLAETYPGEHGLAYAMCALELCPGEDRAVQLAMYYGEQLHRLAEVAPLAAGYLLANPSGVMAGQARQVAGDARPPAAVAPSGPPGAVTSGSYAGHLGGATTAYDSIDDLLERADSLAKKSRKNEAITTYKQVLDKDPTNADALLYLVEQLPLKRKYAELRDILLGAALSPNAAFEDRSRWLREAAELSENQLRDLEGAIGAWQRLVHVEPDNHAAYDQLRRLLERAKRWDDLAAVLANEAENTEDVEARIAIERNLARVHSEHRNDAVAAGEAWARIAGLSPGDEDALAEAVRLFEDAGRADLAADTLGRHVGSLDDPQAKRDLYIKLGDLRAAQGQPREGGEALAEGAAELDDPVMWARAEHYFVYAKAWEQAANAADEQERLELDDEPKAKLLARAASYLLQMNERDEAITRLERAVDLTPTVDEYSTALEQQLMGAGRVSEVVTLFLTRAERLEDPAARVVLRKRAARVQQEYLQDVGAARTSYVAVLRDAQDPETLLWLANDAEQRTDLDAAASYLERLVGAEPDVALRTEHALREARLRARRLGDADAGIRLLHFILDELNDAFEPAMTEIADLEQARGGYLAAAQILERLFATAKADELRLEVAARLAELYERRLEQPHEAIRVLSFVHEADPGDFDATQRLCRLAEDNEKWELVAELMQELVTVEGDAEEASRMTRRLAAVFSDKLEQGDRGLAVLAEAGGRGDAASRDAFVELGDRLGKPAEVARHLVSWYREQPPSPERSEALLAAFQRYVESQSDTPAIEVATELGRSGSATADVGVTLEPIAIRANHLEALRLAHALRVADLEGETRAEEFVRQAEVLAAQAVPVADAIAHGETGLADVEPARAEPLLSRLAALTDDVPSKVAVYENQIGRCTAPETAVPALCRAAEVAVELGDEGQASAFFLLALSGNLPEESLQRMQEIIRDMDKRRDAASPLSLRKVFAESLVQGGQGARDGGKTRSRFLRRAAKLAAFELRDSERGVKWIGDALSQFVEEESLSTLNDIAGSMGDYQIAEQVATRALGEVFDGPMVRELLRYRADLRQDHLDNLAGAAEDLRRLHDLNPGDFDVNGRLATMYDELGDYLGMVKLYEDQILRSRDQVSRAELSRTVARLWQERLDDPRETADAWRRVLRFNAGDEEAKQGLAKAKASMLQNRSADSSALPPPVVEASTPPIVSSVPAVGLDVASERRPSAFPPGSDAPAAPLPPVGLRRDVASGAGSGIGEDLSAEDEVEHTAPSAAPTSGQTNVGAAPRDDERSEHAADLAPPEESVPPTESTGAMFVSDQGESPARPASQAAAEESMPPTGSMGETLLPDEEESSAHPASQAQAPAGNSDETGERAEAKHVATEDSDASDSTPPWSQDEVAAAPGPQPDPFVHAEGDEDPDAYDVDDAEIIDEVDEVDAESELDALVAPRSVAAPPSRRPQSTEAADALKPPPPPSLAGRKE